MDSKIQLNTALSYTQYAQPRITRDAEEQKNSTTQSSQERAPEQFQTKSHDDYLELSHHVGTENSNCSCGKCERCLASSEQEREPSGEQKNRTSEEEKKIQELKKRDQKVRAHEQAHVNAGAKNPQYEYETGPDGQRYATGGHANIDTSKGGSPEESMQIAQKIKRAALAPSEPSSQDRKVAAEAEQMELQAKRELAKKQQKESGELQESPAGTTTTSESSPDEASNQASLGERVRRERETTQGDRTLSDRDRGAAPQEGEQSGEKLSRKEPLGEYEGDLPPKGVLIDKRY